MGTDGTIYVEGTSEYTITVANYEEIADLSGASKTAAWADYEVERPEEVGEPLLGIVLLNGADVVQNVEVGLSFRLFVVADVVGHSVFELARADVLVRRNRLLRIELGRCACHCECRDDEHGDFSHN